MGLSIIAKADAMHLDVVDLRAFYYRTKLGRVAQRAIGEKLAEFWPETKGLIVAGFGFSLPLLRPYLAHSRRVISLMPAQQGVMTWPKGKPNLSILCQEANWPLQTGFVDRLVVLHGLETTENPAVLLEEIWRILAPGGKVVFVVPNRSGLWSRRDGTPFGFGRPFSLGQLESMLRKHRFVPERHLAALFSPPSQKRFWLKVAPAWERFGQTVSSHVAGGVLLVEARKQVYAPTQRGLPEAVRRPLEVLEGIGIPAPKPASGRTSEG